MQPQDIDRIIDVIREEGWLDQTIFISFDLPNMIHVREKLPDQKAQYLAGGGADFTNRLEGPRRSLDLQGELVVTVLCRLQLHQRTGKSLELRFKRTFLRVPNHGERKQEHHQDLFHTIIPK